MQLTHTLKTGLLSLVILSCCLTWTTVVAAKSLVVGMLLAGAHNDNSYNQFHLDAAKTASGYLRNVKVIFIDHANPLMRPPEVTIPAMVDDLVQKGANIIIANTYEMELGISAVASHYPQVTFIQIDGEEALTQTPLPNIVNVTLMFEYAQMLAGFAAGMSTSSGKIAYLGTSPNSDSYRQISAAYLGAKYAWEEVRGLAPKDFRFRLKWMGNWFDNLSPLENTKASTIKLFNEGSDVIIGGNYNMDIFTAAQELADVNKNLSITAVVTPYSNQSMAPFVLGWSYYDWTAIYRELFEQAQQDSLSSNWLIFAPNFSVLNLYGESNVGFVPFDGLSENSKTELIKFVQALAENQINLFRGPLFYKDGSTFTETGQIPTPNVVRNMNQLLEGIEELPYAQTPTSFDNR